MDQPCAHRCALVHALVLALARRDGVPVETARVGRGLTREYVPAVPVPTVPAAPVAPVSRRF